jgi:hypothetical protein
MRRSASLALAALLTLSSCQSDEERDPAAEYRSFVERELGRWRQRHPAYAKAERVEVEVRTSDPPTPHYFGTASYESVVRGDVGNGQKMKLTYRFEVKHAYENGEWAFQSGDVRAIALEITPSDETTEAYIRERLQQDPTPIESVSDADPAGAG